MDRDELKQMEILSCGAGLVLDIGWNGDGSSVMYGLVLSFVLCVVKIGGGPFKLCSGCLWDNFGGVRSSEMAAMRELARQGCLY